MPDARHLQIPRDLAAHRRQLLLDVARRQADVHGDDLLGLVLSGSAGRGLEADGSDLDIYIVLGDGAATAPLDAPSSLLDLIPLRISDLERVPTFGTEGWYARWSFAWAPVLLDRTDGRLGGALHRHSYLPWELQHHPLTDWDEEEILTLVAGMLDGDPHALRRALDRVEQLCQAFDGQRPEPVLQRVFQGWGDSLRAARNGGPGLW